MAIYTNEDAARNDQAAREWDLARGERKRAFEREMKGDFKQNADLQRQLQGTWRDRALEERALRGTFDQNAALRREMEGPWADRNKAENWRANLASNTQIRGQDLAAQTARYGTDSGMIENAAQRSFMDRIYRMQDETQRGSHESLGKDRRLKLYSDAWLNLQDDAFRAFPEDEAKRNQYMQQGRKQLDQLFPEFGKPKPGLSSEMEFGGGGAGNEPGSKTPSRAPYNGGRTVTEQGQPSMSRPRRFTAPENMGLPIEGFESTNSPYSVRKGFFASRERVPSTYRDPITGMDMQGFETRRRGTPVGQTQQPEPSMDALTRRTLQMYDLPQSNATENAMTVLNGGQRPMRKPIPKQEYPGFNGWEDVRRRTGGF